MFTGYLSGHIEDLPNNVLLDKGKTGCGATTLALKNNVNYVIAVPFVSLIENKLSQNEGVIGVYGESMRNKSKLINYLKKPRDVYKLIVTYDNICTVIEYIEKYNSLENFKLLIDEYHLLFNQYAFREEAVQKVLQNYTKFKNYCFMTATPLEDEFLLEEIKHLPKEVYEWEDVREVTVKSIKCEKDLTPTVQNLVSQHLDGTISGNAYIFVNSIAFINKLIRNLNLTVNNTRVICSKQAKRLRLPISTLKSDPSEVRKINLLTSTAFEGSDIYDSEGRIYIVSDSSMSHTLTDISTSFQQIAGRIRDTKYWETITHIYTTTRYGDYRTYTEFKEASEQLKEESKIISVEYNTLSELARQKMETTSLYLSRKEGKFYLDGNKVQLDLHNFKITQVLYKLRINVKKELEEYNYNVEEVKEPEPIILNLSLLPGTFKECIRQLREVYIPNTESITYEEEIVHHTFYKYPWLQYIIDTYGYGIITKQNYVISKLKPLYEITQSKTDINKEIYKAFKEGQFLPSKELKGRLVRVYEKTHINKTPTVKDLDLYFITKHTNKWIQGKSVKGYLLVKSLKGVK